ncbi:MAG: hypothetical protein MZV65_18960 [Chromatiales bacterium]|nr:hypothetical protein [Chromatiales bacterium]
MLNALAVMQLAGEGRLDLDRPFTDYLPEFCHENPLAAGGADQRACACYATTRGCRPITSRASSPTTRSTSCSGSCATSISRSNRTRSSTTRTSAPNLLGHGARAAHRPRLCRGHAQSPARTARHAATPGSRPTARSARGWRAATCTTQEVDPTPIRDLPAGGLYSNVLDLARFMRMVFAGGAIDGRSVFDAPAAGAKP